MLPNLGEDELRFRVAAVGGILHVVTGGAAGLEGKPAAQIERLLVPVVTGALAGAPPRRDAGGVRAEPAHGTAGRGRPGGLT